MHSKLGTKVKLRERMFICIGQYKTTSKPNFRSVTILSSLCKMKNVTDDSFGGFSDIRIEIIDNRGCFLLNYIRIEMVHQQHRIKTTTARPAAVVLFE